VERKYCRECSISLLPYIVRQSNQFTALTQEILEREGKYWRGKKEKKAVGRGDK